MALTSPGVQVSVVDESFYTPAEPGTVPVIFVASAENKTNASGSGTAVGTLAANAGKAYLLTSQRDLAETFGDPTFQVDTNNTPVHGSELNEYGLQAAYSYLGVSNRAWVVRADVDLGQLVAKSEPPTANPDDGTYWLDTSSSLFGIQEWNNAAESTTGGQTFTNKVPLVITSILQTSGSAPYAPKDSVGTIGDYAVVTGVSTLDRIWYRATTGWVEVGSNDWQEAWPTLTSSKTTGTLTASSFTLNGTIVTTGGTIATLVSTINNLSISGISAAEVNGELAIYSDGTSSGAGDSTQAGEVVIAAGQGGVTDALTELGIDAGTYLPPALQISKHTVIPDSFKTTSGSNGRATGSVWIKTTTPNLGARWRVKLWNADTELWESIAAPIYPTSEQALLELDRTGGGDNLSLGDLYIASNVAGDNPPLATFRIFRRGSQGPTAVTSAIITSSSFAVGSGNYTLDIESTSPGSAVFTGGTTVSFAGSADATALASTIAAAITSAKVPYINAEVDSQNRIVIKHSAGGEIRFTERSDSEGDVVSRLGISDATDFVSDEPGIDNDTAPIKQYRASNWKQLDYTSSDTEITNTAANGTLWYNSIVDEVDIMINNGTTWVGYQYDGTGNAAFGDASPGNTNGADENGPIVSASQPTKQSGGGSLVEGDLWINTSDIENYPQIYKYNKTTEKWVLVDNTDQTTENGIVFADARYGTSGANGNTSATIKELLSSNYLDPDAPDPALYPKGTLLFNTRRSGFNVKQFVEGHVTEDINQRFLDEDTVAQSYTRDRWVTVSGNNEDGSGSFGRKAQRKVVVQALQSVVNSNDEIRNEDARRFNLIAAPGYPELIGELITLNVDRGLTAFVVGDSPARLTPDATSLNEWATNVRAAVEDNDNGLVTNDEYLGVFYPWGFTSDNAGNNVVVPPSHMMLRTIALSDQVSYPWFAPAGTRRGGVTNASSTGYINSEAEFVAVALNEGQRDTLYSNSVNPITFITGAGLVNYGQKTRARGASSLDRINVARLVVYLRSQLNSLAKPYIFEPNDKITRDEIKQQVESLLLELVGQRALYDFLVVCDETNNTPSRIDRNELYVDIAIEPVKSIEFIYIPLRLKNTGEIAAAG